MAVARIEENWRITKTKRGTRGQRRWQFYFSIAGSHYSSISHSPFLQIISGIPSEVCCLCGTIARILFPLWLYDRPARTSRVLFWFEALCWLWQDHTAMIYLRHMFLLCTSTNHVKQREEIKPVILLFIQCVRTLIWFKSNVNQRQTFGTPGHLGLMY